MRRIKDIVIICLTLLRTNNHKEIQHCLGTTNSCMEFTATTFVGAGLLVVVFAFFSSQARHKKRGYDYDKEDVGSKMRMVSAKAKFNKNIVEVCLSDIESVHNARNGGASSVELCTARYSGGVTPSLGLIEEAVGRLKGCNTEVHVLIRPRDGDFLYSFNEFDCILRDILHCKQAGADGVVVGFLKQVSNGSRLEIDYARLRVVKELLSNSGMSVTFNRAFDLCDGTPEVLLESVIEAGCDRLLTSGCARSATSEEGKAMLVRLVKHAAGRIKIIAAAGVTPENVSSLIAQTGVDGVHAGSSVVINRKSCRRTNNKNKDDSTLRTVRMGLATDDDTDDDMWQCADTAKVRALSSAAREEWNSISSSGGASPGVSPLLLGIEGVLNVTSIATGGCAPTTSRPASGLGYDSDDDDDGDYKYSHGSAGRQL